MNRFLLVCLVVLLPAAAGAQIEAEDPSDYVRVLESGDPYLWNEAVRGLLGEKDELPLRSVSSVVRRIDDLDYALQVRLARAFRHNRRHPLALDALVRFSRDPDETLHETAFESLFTLRSPEAMDVFCDLVWEAGPQSVHALRALAEAYKEWLENLRNPYLAGMPDPELDTSRDAPEERFDQRYLPAARTLLTSSVLENRRDALDIVASVITPGVNEEIARLMEDTDSEIRDKARWELAERGDPRPCPALFEEAEGVARTSTDAYSRDRRLQSVGSVCAPSFFLDYLRWYMETGDELHRGLYREMIEGATDLDLLDHPDILEGLAPYTDSPDDFIRETARRILGWEREAKQADRTATIKSAYDHSSW